MFFSIANSSLDIAEKTVSEPQDTLELKMIKQKECFSFEVHFELPEQWMSLVVYNTVNDISEKNNKLKILLIYEHFKSINIDTQLVLNVEYYIETLVT